MASLRVLGERLKCKGLACCSGRGCPLLNGQFTIETVFLGLLRKLSACFVASYMVETCNAHMVINSSRSCRLWTLQQALYRHIITLVFLLVADYFCASFSARADFLLQVVSVCAWPAVSTALTPCVLRCLSISMNLSSTRSANLCTCGAHS